MLTFYLQSLEAPLTTHSTWLKNKILTEIPDLQLIHKDFLSNRNKIESKTLWDALRIMNLQKRHVQYWKSFQWIPPQSVYTNQFCSTPTCFLFVTYLEEPVKMMVMVMFPTRSLTQLLYSVWRKDVKKMVQATPINNNVVKLLLLFMFDFLFLMQQDLQIWFMLY